MLFKYLKVYKKQIALFILIIALVVVSSVTKGKIGTIAAYAAGIAMIYAGISFVLWIIRTPVKKDMDDGV